MSEIESVSARCIGDIVEFICPHCKKINSILIQDCDSWEAECWFCKGDVLIEVVHD